MAPSITALFLALGISLGCQAQKIPLTGVFIPPEYAYLLSQPYTGNLNKNFIDTQTANSSANNVFAAARNVQYYFFDQEFMTILDLRQQSNWLQTTPALLLMKPFYSYIDLDTNVVTTPTDPAVQGGVNPAGGSYFGGLVYFAALGNISESLAPAVYSIDPVTLTSTLVLDSYFGVHLNSIDDMAWVGPNTTHGSTSCTHPGEANLFFTTIDLGANKEPGFSQAVLPNAVFRFTPSTKSLQAVISRGDILAPNGISADPRGKYLYVTDSALTLLSGPGSNSSGSPAIYRYELDADCNPMNKQLFATVRSGLADGIHVDNFGRVWTAEFNGIVVRNSRGKELGVFNAEQLVEPAFSPISNFALAGDKLVILSGDHIWVVQLGQNVTTPAGKSS